MKAQSLGSVQNSLFYNVWFINFFLIRFDSMDLSEKNVKILRLFTGRMFSY